MTLNFTKPRLFTHLADKLFATSSTIPNSVASGVTTSRCGQWRTWLMWEKWHAVQQPRRLRTSGFLASVSWVYSLWGITWDSYLIWPYPDTGRDFKMVGFDNRKEWRTALVTISQSLVFVSVGHNILRKFCDNVDMHGRFVRWHKWRACDVGEAKEGREGVT